MPFFYLDIDVKGFSRTGYKEIIKSLDKIHLSEISIIETKAKSLKIGEKRSDVNKRFNEGLSVLSADEKVVIHGYRSMDDEILTFKHVHKIGSRSYHPHSPHQNINPPATDFATL